MAADMIGGAGSTTVNGNLTANAIVQSTLTIGAGGSVTIREITTGPVNSTWAVNLDGKWTTPGNWSPTSVPNVAGATANFTSNTPTTVTVDSPVTAGTINFTTGTPYTISGSGANRITMQQVGSSGAAAIAIQQSGAVQTIKAPLVIASNTESLAPVLWLPATLPRMPARC